MPDKADFGVFAWSLATFHSIYLCKRASKNLLAGGKNFPQISLYPLLLPPVAGIAQRNLFKSHAILVICRSYMQVPINHNRGWKTHVPILCALRSAPERKAGDAIQPHQGFTQWKMIDKDKRSARRRFLQALFRILAARKAPGRAGRIGIRVQEVLV